MASAVTVKLIEKLILIENELKAGRPGLTDDQQLRLVGNMLNILEDADDPLEGGSLFSSAFKKISNIRRKKDPKSRQLLDGETHCPLLNFSGPGTRIDLPEVRSFPPYNDIDAAAKAHDLAYERAGKLPRSKQVKAIREADRILLEEIEKYPNQKGYKCTKLGIKGKQGLERFAPSIAKKVLGESRTGVE